MTDFKHQLPSDLSTSVPKANLGGMLWIPSIAMPYFVGFGLKKAKCGCGRVFKTQEDFEAHYFYQAVVKGESDVLPTQWRDLSKKLEVKK